MNGRILKASVLGSAAMAAGCAMSSVVHQPTQDTAPRLTQQQARSLFMTSMAKAREEKCMSTTFPRYVVTALRADSFEINGGGICRFADADIAAIRDPCGLYVRTCGSAFFFFADEADARAAVNAAYVLKHGLYSDAGVDFADVVRQYRGTRPKPVLSEEARKFKVQAEFAISQKRFSDALSHYSSALEAAPWWPEGHFNSALIFAETEDYESAIASMQRYLQLVPEAPDARAAQDRVYQWQSMLPR